MSCWSSAEKDVPRERIMTFSNGNVQKSGSVGRMTSNGTSAADAQAAANAPCDSIGRIADQMCPSSRPPRAHGPHLRPATHCETVSTFSHFETGVVSSGILGLLASWKPLPSLSLAACPAAESPSHAAYFSAPTAQRGIVFAPSASMTQSSTGKTPCVVGR